MGDYMVKKIILLLVLLASDLFATNYVTLGSGNFADPTIWTNNCAPFLSGDTWTISEGHTVTYTNNFYTTSYWGNSVIQGTFQITNTAYIRFGGTVGGTGFFNVGSISNPIRRIYPSSNEAVVIQFTNSTSYISTQNIYMYGEEKTNFWTTLSSNAAIGTNILWINDPIDISSNDVIVSGTTAKNYTGYMLHYVTNYNVETPPYYLVIGSNEYLNFSSRYPAIYTNITTTARVADYGFIGIVSQNILIFRSPLANNASLIAFSSNVTLRGVRVYLSGSGITGQSRFARFYSCTSQNVNNGGFNGENSLYPCYVDNCLSIASPFNRTSFGDTVTNSVVIGSASGGTLTGIKGNFYNCYMYNSSLAWAGSGAVNNKFYNCKVIYSSYTFSYLSSGNMFFDCEAYFSDNGPPSYRSSGNYFKNCISKNGSGSAASYAGLTLLGSYDVFENCTAISNLAANFSQSSVNTKFLNCTSVGTVLLMRNCYNDYISAGQWNLIEDSTSRVFYTRGGMCNSQTNLLAYPNYGYTYKHNIFYDSKECFWFENINIRSYGVGRWSVYMYKENDSITQTAIITLDENNRYNPFSDSSSILIAVTNTASTSTWYTADLSWQNTSSIPMNVTLWVSALGISNDVAYSAAVKSDDKIIKIVP